MISMNAGIKAHTSSKVASWMRVTVSKDECGCRDLPIATEASLVYKYSSFQVSEVHINHSRDTAEPKSLRGLFDR
jgi:hypothetical protein